MHAFASQHEELAKAGLREVVAFHSPAAELLEHQARFPFEVVGAPAKQLYRTFGVEKSLWAVLDPRAWFSAMKGNLKKDRPPLKGMPNGGVLGLPPDFLVAADGSVKAVHYGSHANDQWSVDGGLAHTTR